MAQDAMLVDALKNTNLFEEVIPVSSNEDLTSDCVIISEELLPYTELHELNFSPNQKVFYMLRNDIELGLEKAVKTICDSKNILFIPPRLTVEQISLIVVDQFNEESEKKGTKAITFFAPISNIGTTSTCLSVAHSLQENTNAKIGVLLINAWDQGTYQLDFKGQYLDVVKSSLANKALNNEDEFLSMFHMEEENSLYILGGNRYTKLERLYTKEEIHYLIELSKKYFDVVLIDAGSHFDNAIMVQALHESDLQFLVMNQQPKAINSFNQIYQEILYPLGYKKTDFMTILNRFIDKPYLVSPKDMFEQFELMVISTIYETENPFFTEIERKSLYQFDDHVYKESILKIVRSISNHAQLEMTNHNKATRKRWFFSKGAI